MGSYSEGDELSSATVDRITKRNLGKLDEQVAKDVLLGLDRKPFIVCVGVVKQLGVLVAPNASNNLSSELEHAEDGVLAEAELEAMGEVNSILVDDQPL